MIYAIIKDSTVVNMVIAETPDVLGLQEGESSIENNDGALYIGSKLIDGVWVLPENQ